MARNGRNLISGRRVAAGALIFVGLFLTCYGFGWGSQTLVVTGAAVVVLSFSFRLFTSLRRAPRQWVLGTAHVLEVSEPPAGVRYGRCTLQLVVDAPGAPDDVVVVNEARAPVAQWPRSGAELPVEVAADDPRIVRILWKNMRTSDAPSHEFALVDVADVETDEDIDQPLLPPPVPPLERPATIDFDLDHPPPAAPRGSHPGSPPILTPLPPELGPMTPVTTLREPWPEPEQPVPRPRPTGAKPSPRPRPPREPALAGAGAGSATVAAGSPVADPLTTFPSANPGPAGTINHVGVTVLVSDLAQSVAFYRDRLGFYEDAEADAGTGSIVLASGETRLVLRASRDLGSVRQRSVFLNLEVGDIHGVYANLRASGVTFLRPPEAVSRGARRELWAATFRDPDGHGIALTQWRESAGSAAPERAGVGDGHG